MEKGWIVTDPDNNQMRKQVSEKIFLFKEDRIINPETKKTRLYESEINLNDYTIDEMFNAINTFGYSYNEMCTWIDDGKNLDLICECIFELEENPFHYESDY